MCSIGCGLHSNRVQLCLIDDDPAHDGYPLPEETVLLEANVPATRVALAEWIGKADRECPGPKALAVETTANWEWFVDAAALLVEEVHLVHATRAKAIASSKIKTDRIDARVLADSLEVIDHLNGKIEAADAYLDGHDLRPAPMVRRLKTTPGFGQRLSMHASLEIVDITRFPGHKDYVSYSGLAPGTHISDQTKRRRGLRPHGNRYLKWIYTHCGPARRPPSLLPLYLSAPGGEERQDDRPLHGGPEAGDLPLPQADEGGGLPRRRVTDHPPGWAQAPVAHEPESSTRLIGNAALSKPRRLRESHYTTGHRAPEK